MTDTAKQEEAVATTTAWVPPTADSEFVFSDMASVPGWVDPGWQSNDNTGIALAVPAFAFAKEGETMDRSFAYHTTVARVGDTVKWVEAERRFVVEHPTTVAASAEDLAQANIGVAPKDQVNPYDNPPKHGAGTIGALQNPPPPPTPDPVEDDVDDPYEPVKKAKKK